MTTAVQRSTVSTVGGFQSPHCGPDSFYIRLPLLAVYVHPNRQHLAKWEGHRVEHSGHVYSLGTYLVYYPTPHPPSPLQHQGQRQQPRRQNNNHSSSPWKTGLPHASTDQRTKDPPAIIIHHRLSTTVLSTPTTLSIVIFNSHNCSTSHIRQRNRFRL